MGQELRYAVESKAHLWNTLACAVQREQKVQGKKTEEKKQALLPIPQPDRLLSNLWLVRLLCWEQCGRSVHAVKKQNAAWQRAIKEKTKQKQNYWLSGATRTDRPLRDGARDVRWLEYRFIISTQCFVHELVFTVYYSSQSNSLLFQTKTRVTFPSFSRIIIQNITPSTVPDCRVLFLCFHIQTVLCCIVLCRNPNMV